MSGGSGRPPDMGVFRGPLRGAPGRPPCLEVFLSPPEQWDHLESEAEAGPLIRLLTPNRAQICQCECGQSGQAGPIWPLGRGVLLRAYRGRATAATANGHGQMA
ncbi:unnamed protein product [Boreogadus saida]